MRRDSESQPFGPNPKGNSGQSWLKGAGSRKGQGTILCGLIMLGTAPAASAVPTYSVTEIVPSAGLTPGVSIHAEAVNENGQVAGWEKNPATGTTNGFRWETGSGITHVGDLPGGDYFSKAYGINNAGHVVGTSDFADKEQDYQSKQGFIWKEGEGMTGLGSLPGGGDSSKAYDINNHGQVVGHASSSERYADPYLWEEGRGMEGLESVPSDFDRSTSFSSARAINDKGQVTGEYLSYTHPHALLWEEGGGVADLESWESGPERSNAYDLNEKGQVAGTSYTHFGNFPMVWEEGEGWQALGPVHRGAAGGRALGINDSGQVVGEFGQGLFEDETDAFFWEEGSGMRQLEGLIDPNSPYAGIDLESATDINNLGQVVAMGTGAIPSVRQNHAYLLTPQRVLPPEPVPAPSTLALMGLGVMGLTRALRQKAS
ncbi:DUF3466 family protein [Thiohalorhabdus methylotrophus]|uniref:DUF3466 family protein n=1 Tax=Thiohalorhabdus methylotrophus TaxID=3242694 RepID=A0ABV4TS58_9GAMM